MYMKIIYSQIFIRPLYAFYEFWLSSFVFSLGDLYFLLQCIAWMLIIYVVHCLFKYQTV